MKSRKSADKKPTWVHLVSQAMVEYDDFMTAYDLIAATGGTINQVSAALSHLRKCKAADCLAVEGQLFWFDTSGSDTRLKTVDERVPEEPGTRRRASRRTLENL